jgi:hypothetical protein
MLVMIAYKKFANVTITGILTKSRHYKKTFVTYPVSWALII